MAGGLNQDVGRLSQRQKAPAPQALDKMRNHMIVRSSHKLERDAGIFEPELQGVYGMPDLLARITIETRQNVGGASHALDAFAHIGASYCKRRA
jgi:hypothetical protein